MLTDEFDYDLPPDLIAQRPTKRRRDSRLLILAGGQSEPEDSHFQLLPEVLVPGDLLVLNDTRVVPARVYGRKSSGGRVEILLERLLSETRALVQIRASKPPGSGTAIEADGGGSLLVKRREGPFYVLEKEDLGNLEEFFATHGHVPLPPYIRRPDEAGDAERYQTVYATRPGAVAAPTAGLHFDREMLTELASRGIRQLSITLHVGSGTFQPLRLQTVEENRLHAERFQVGPSAVQEILETRAAGGRVVAVGTTVARALEAAAAGGELSACEGETELFIYPGYQFRVVDAMLTNFHLPASSLLMLVCAFGGYARVMEAYCHALAQRYRFFSYGDAMFLTRCAAPDLPPSASADDERGARDDDGQAHGS